MDSKHCLTSVTLPDSVTIFGTNINVHIDEVDDGELGNLTESRISLETLILRNHTKIKRNVRLKYDIQFICCSSKITEIERKHIMRKHRKKYMYDSMEPVAKKRFLEDIKRKYSTMDARKKKELLSQPNEKLVKARSVELCTNQFKRKIRQGPYFICIVYNRILYKKSVITCINEKYPCQTYFNIQQSFDGKQCICNTCHSKVIKGKLPCQAVVNNMYVDEIPTKLSSLEKLQQIQIALEKIVVMHKGQQRKIKGAICNVPVECDQTCNQLPHPPDRSCIIILKLIRKLQSRGHVYFQASLPELIQQVLNWLKVHNHCTKTY